MLINNATVNTLRAEFSDAYQAGFDRAPLVYDPIVMRVSSGSRKNIYGFLQKQLRLREWNGPRDIRAIEESGFEVVNRKYQESIEVSREDIEDDILGVYRDQLFPDLGEAAAMFPQQLLRDTLQSASGAGPTAFDGVALFSGARDYGGGTIDNIGSGGDLTPDNFNTAWSAMASYRDKDGEPLGVMATHLIVPPQLRRAALEVTQATTNFAVAAGAFDGAVDNVMRGWCDVIVMTELANEPAKWYLADLSKGAKPIVFQERTQPELVARTSPDDPKVFDLDVFAWGVRYRCAMAAGLPHLIYSSGS